MRAAPPRSTFLSHLLMGGQHVRSANIVRRDTQGASCQPEAQRTSLSNQGAPGAKFNLLTLEGSIGAAGVAHLLLLMVSSELMLLLLERRAGSFAGPIQGRTDQLGLLD